MLKGVWFFRGSFSKSGLLETSQLGLTPAEENVSSHCWKFWANGCFQNTAEQSRSTPPTFLDKYLFSLTAVASKQKGFRTFLKQSSGCARWLGMKRRGAGAAWVSRRHCCTPVLSGVGGWPASARLQWWARLCAAAWPSAGADGRYGSSFGAIQFAPP